ncbi:winged helix-turn-helix transcriptional regulator [Candidatus Woesearchaeota archaeon]|nr:winged helix-turn-helix transcriptional regulator [Candidatus Woesearchaeota archaeon]
MNNKDLVILCNLRSDSRMQLTQMSKRTGIPVSTLHERIARQDYIKRFTIVADFARFGFDTKVHALLCVKQEDKDAVKEHLLNSPYVNTLCRINNGYDYLLEAYFCNLAQVEAFFEHLEKNYKIRSKVIHYILEEIAQEAFLSRPSHADWASGRGSGHNVKWIQMD